MTPLLKVPLNVSVFLKWLVSPTAPNGNLSFSRSLSWSVQSSSPPGSEVFRGTSWANVSSNWARSPHLIFDGLNQGEIRRSQKIIWQKKNRCLVPKTRRTWKRRGAPGSTVKQIYFSFAAHVIQSVWPHRVQSGAERARCSNRFGVSSISSVNRKCVIQEGHSEERYFTK